MSMKHLRYVLVALGLLCSSQVHAATCFAVAASGSVSWSTSNAAIWASSSGGTAGTCAAIGNVPKNTGDVATIDSNSGGGTITLDSSMAGASISEINIPTGTETLNTNGVNFTLTAAAGAGFSMAAAGATINCSTSTITLTGSAAIWTVAGTVSCASGSFVLNGSSSTNVGQTFAGNGATYGSLTVNGRTNGSSLQITGSNTFTNMAVSGPVRLFINGNDTISNAFAWNETSTTPIIIHNSSVNGTAATITAGAVSTISWAAIQGMTFAGSSVTASNSLNVGGNSGTVTITAPSGGGGNIQGIISAAP